MKCWHCGSDMIWDNDYDYSEIYGDGEGIVTILHCSECRTTCEFILRTDEE